MTAAPGSADGWDSEAIHESGHAVVADELGIAYGMITILPAADAMDFAVGTDAAAHALDVDADERWAMERAIVDYAGHAAVVILRGSHAMNARDAQRCGAGTDFARAATRLRHDRRRLAHAKARALEIVTRRRADVETVAAMLLNRGRLTEGQVTWLLQYGEPLPCEI